MKIKVLKLCSSLLEVYYYSCVPFVFIIWSSNSSSSIGYRYFQWCRPAHETNTSLYIGYQTVAIATGMTSIVSWSHRRKQDITILAIWGQSKSITPCPPSPLPPPCLATIYGLTYQDSETSVRQQKVSLSAEPRKVTRYQTEAITWDRAKPHLPCLAIYYPTWLGLKLVYEMKGYKSVKNTLLQ